MMAPFVQILKPYRKVGSDLQSDITEIKMRLEPCFTSINIFIKIIRLITSKTFKDLLQFPVFLVL